SAPKTCSEDAARSGCRGVGMAEPVGCFKNCLTLALVVPPFSYPHHSPQRLAFFARTNGYALRRFMIEANCIFDRVQNTVLQHK
ncbi:hypothetical protein K443DRAFT_117585, partial [Laccaria amethystina LaAM-08-1]